jgi:hypothetical protein
MRNLYKPVRYNVASIQSQQTLGGDCMESNENGIWVEFRDYLRLLEDYKSLQQWNREADAETLKFDSGDWFASKTLPERIKYIVESHARLKDEVERLTKAGDAMASTLKDGGIIVSGYALADEWLKAKLLAAKEGKQS